ncbi:hypothetical protein KKC94_05785 [Patescibacteria group bacterium]|nr:hypothetical protein [Patescibacteria group bacterium]
MENIQVIPGEDRGLVLEMPHSGYPRGLNANWDPKGDFACNVESLDSAIRANVRWIRGDGPPQENAQLLRTIIGGVDVGAPAASGALDFKGKYPLVYSKVPRAFVDVNFGRDDVGGAAALGAGEPRLANGGPIWTHSAIIADSGRWEFFSTVAKGLFGRADSLPMLERPYTQEEFERIMSIYVDTYETAVRDRLGEKGIVAALHTMPPNEVGTVKSGPNDGAFIIGPEVSGVGGSIWEIMNGKMPDVMLISNGGKSCAPWIVDAIKGVFKDHNLIAIDGFGPMIGDRGGTVKYGKPDRDMHFLGIELIPRDLETGRIRSSLNINLVRAAVYRRVYRDVFAVLEECAGRL